MKRSYGSVVALIAVGMIATACGGGGSPETVEAQSAEGGTTGAHAGTVTDAGTGTIAPTAGGAGGGAQPATAGNGTCLDLASPVVTKAVAGLPLFRGSGYRAVLGTDAKLGACPDLMWVEAMLDKGTGSSPEWILFFDRQGYLGTATSRYTSFTQVTGSTGDTVAVTYRWLNPGDATAGPSGGPVVVNYTLSGRTVTPDRDVPPQVFDGGAATTAPTTTTAPVSHCAEATAATLQSTAELNWGNRIVKPFTVDSIVCADDWARARIPARPGYQQNAMVLFRYTGGGWSGIEFGSGFSCVDKGVPAATAAQLTC